MTRHRARARIGCSGYADEELESWAQWICATLAAGRDVYACFNNDWGGHAPKDAMRLRTIVLSR